jgi:hypothetical protein
MACSWFASAARSSRIWNSKSLTARSKAVLAAIPRFSSSRAACQASIALAAARYAADRSLYGSWKPERPSQNVISL